MKRAIGIAVPIMLVLILAGCAQTEALPVENTSSLQVIVSRETSDYTAEQEHQPISFSESEEQFVRTEESGNVQADFPEQSAEDAPSIVEVPLEQTQPETEPEVELTPTSSAEEPKQQPSETQQPEEEPEPEPETPVQPAVPPSYEEPSDEPAEEQIQEPVTEPEPVFDINCWIAFAQGHAQQIGLNLSADATACWDNPITAGAHCKYLERDITDRLNRYSRDEEITDVWIWTESRSDGSYDLFIGYA